MNAFRKYAVWIVGLGLAAFIIPSVVGSIGKFSSNTKPSVKKPGQPYEPPFRMDGTVWALNGSDTTAVFETEYATTPETIEIGMMYRRTTPPNRAMLFFMPGGDQQRSFLDEEHARVVASLDLGRGLGSVARGVRRASPVVQGCARNRHPRTHGSRVRVRVDDVRHDQGDEKVVNEYSIFCV